MKTKMKLTLSDGTLRLLNSETEIKDFIKSDVDGTYTGTNNKGEDISVYLISKVGMEVTTEKKDGTTGHDVYNANGKHTK